MARPRGKRRAGSVVLQPLTQRRKTTPPVLSVPRLDHPASCPWPTTAAVSAALDRAQAGLEASKHPAALAVLTPGALSTGLLQLPATFAAGLPQGPGSHSLTLWSGGSKAGYAVRWIRQPTGGGRFHTGWRAFAKAHKLEVGDALLLERLSPVSLRISLFPAAGPGDSAGHAALAPCVPTPRLPSAQQPRRVEDVVLRRLGPGGHTEYLTLWHGEQEATWERREALLVGGVAPPPLARFETSLRKLPGAVVDREYDVEAILQHRRGKGGQLEYLTAWRGYTTRTWEPRTSFVWGDVVTEALVRYEAQLKPRAASKARAVKAQAEYEVEAIIGHRQTAGGVEYLTAWRGYATQTWEPRASFGGAAVTRALLRYEAAYGLRPP